MTSELKSPRNFPDHAHLVVQEQTGTCGLSIVLFIPCKQDETQKILQSNRKDFGLLTHLRGFISTQEVALCDSYASFVLSNLLHAFTSSKKVGRTATGPR